MYEEIPITCRFALLEIQIYLFYLCLLLHKVVGFCYEHALEGYLTVTLSLIHI